jgi:hypothetical protein
MFERMIAWSWLPFWQQDGGDDGAGKGRGEGEGEEMV